MPSYRVLTVGLIAAILCCLAGAVGGAAPPTVAAQSGRVTLDIADAELPVGGTTVVDVRIENVTDLYGGEIAVSYDPSVVEVVDEDGVTADEIEGGDFLDPNHTTAFVNRVDARAGLIEYAATLRNNPRRPVEAVSGTGVFARIRFKGVGGGATPIAFSTEGATYVREIRFVHGDFEEFTLPTVDGSLTVRGAAPVYLPVALKRFDIRSAPGRQAPPSSLDASHPRWTSDAPAAFGGRRYSRLRDDGDPVSSPSRLLDVPVQLVSTRSSLRHIAVTDAWVYWTEGGGEFGCLTEADEASLSRVSRSTGTAETLLKRCDFDPTVVLADDGGAVYYMDAFDGSIVSFSIDWMSGTTFEVLMARGAGITHSSPMTMNDTHLFFADRDGIKRRARGTGDTEVVVAGARAMFLAADAGHVYWIDNSGATVPQRVRRAPVTGGSPETLYENVDDDTLRALALDGGHVYWSQSGGVARRVPKGGGTIDDYGVAGSYMAGGVAVDDANVYFYDEIRLQRQAKNRSTPAETLAPMLTGIKDLTATDAELVFGGVSHDQGVWTLPIDASEETIDLQVNWIEVTQAIQNLVNDAPLVRHKPTLVRVYPATTSGMAHDVPMQLSAFRGGSELPGSPLDPIVPTLSVRYQGAARERLDETFNFLLPEGWTEGTVELRATINPGGSVPEGNRTNNQLTETVTFTARDAMCIEAVSVRTEPRTGSTRTNGFDEIVDWVASAYPVPGVRVIRGGMVQEPAVCWWGPFPYPCGEPYEMPNDSDSVLAGIWWYNLWDGRERGCDTQFYTGLVHQDGIDRDGTIGSSYVGGRELWTTMDTNPDYLGAAWPWYLPFGGAIMAHELGHSLSRRHVDCGDPADDTIQAGYPYNRCDIGPDDPIGYYGMDVLDMAVIPPTEAGDLMSYAHNEGKPEWPSDWTYRALMGGLPADDFVDFDAAQGGGLDGSASPIDDLVHDVLQSARNLAVTGVVSPTDGTAALGTIKMLPAGLADAGKLAQLTARVDTGPSARYALQLQDGGGTVLGEVRFDVPDEVDAPDDGRSFQVIMPYDTNAARIVLKEGARALSDRAVSASPPTVTVSKPNGGETVSGPLTVEWVGKDTDNDPLSYTVQYSPDAGATWQPLAIGVFAETVTVDDMTSIPGSDQALVRVIAGDGVLTGSDESDAPFRVPRQDPDVRITRPDDGAVVAPGQKILVTGRAYDPEDGTLQSGQLKWLADGAPVGEGTFATIPAMAPGEHTVTLRAVDTDQQTGEDSITIFVQDLACAEGDRVDIVFVLDTSPDMVEQLDRACGTTKDILDALYSGGMHVRHRTLGVAQARACAKSSVRDVLGAQSIDHPADWGLAVRELSAKYPWRPGATRVIVPLTNQGPENGDPVEDPGPDRDVIKQAIAAASRNQVRVFPILMLAGLGPQPEPPEMPVARSLASATQGRVFRWSVDKAIGAGLVRALPQVSCVPTAAGVSPSCGFDAGDTLTLFGSNLAVGTQVHVGAHQARDVQANADGTRITFRVPADLPPGRTYDIRVDRTGVGGETLSGAITFGPCSDRCDGYAPGDIALPMWRVRSDRGEVVFEARATGPSLTARLYAHDGPMKLLVQEADGTGLLSAGVTLGSTGEVTVPTTPGNTYLVIARNAHAPATRFRLYARGTAYLRTADDGDDWASDVLPGRGEDHGAASHPELGFAGRWRDLGPAFERTTWYFDVGAGDDELAVHVWSEGHFGEGHGGMSWVRPDGTVQPLIGAEGATFDHTWRVADPMPGRWGLLIEPSSGDAPEYVVIEPDDPDPDAPADVPDVLYFFADYLPQGYTLARVDSSADDWLYFLPHSMVGPPCGPSVLLVPGMTHSCLGNLQPMDIVVADVVNLFGAEVHLVFDPARLEVVTKAGDPASSVKPGDLLDPDAGLIGANFADNEFGLIDFALSLKDPAPSTFGTGVLASTYFRAKTAGRAEVKIDEAKLSERPEPPLPPVRIEPDVRGAAFASEDCYAGGQTAPGTVLGRAILDGRGDHGGARVSLGAGPTTLTLTDGAYVLSGITPGDHELDVVMPGYLRAGSRTFSLEPSTSSELPDATLLGGDCDGDDEIGIVDGAISARFFGLTEGWPSDKVADINADGIVDIFDLVLVGNNFGCAVDDTVARCQRWDR